MKLSLVVPCYNEEKNVREFYATALRAFEGAEYELEMVFVDDGSTDNTLAELKELFESDGERVRIVTFSRNFGKEAAILAGMREAEGDCMTIIDADLQQKPSIARAMFEFLLSEPDYDCVAACQSDRVEDKTLSFFKKAFYKLINKLSDVPFEQGASDFRTFRRDMAEAIIALPEYQRFSKGLFAWVGFKTKYIDYKADERNAGKSKWTFFKLLKYALDGIMAYTVKPLYVPIAVGAALTFVSFIWFIIDIIAAAAGADLKLWGVILLMFFFFGGVQLLSVGVLGSYLSKLYIQSKNRPNYIVRRIYKSDSAAVSGEDKNNGSI